MLALLEDVSRERVRQEGLSRDEVAFWTQEDGALAIILSHEVSHVVLGHHREVEPLQSLVWLLRALGAIVTDGASLALDFVGFFDILVNRPLSRVAEAEADRVGISLMTRACYDTRFAGGLWAGLDGLLPDASGWAWFLSTHPTHKSRARDVARWGDLAYARTRGDEATGECAVMRQRTARVYRRWLLAQQRAAQSQFLSRRLLLR